LALPIGFGLIGLRLVWHAAPQWRGRVLTLAMAGAVVGFAAFFPIDPGKLRLAPVAPLLPATLPGAPRFSGIGGAGLILFWSDHSAIAAVPLKHYSLVTNPSLPTIPLFTLAGYFLAESGASTRLVSLFQSLFGSWRGGPAIATALVCAFFTSFTGASGVTILAF